MSQEKHTAEELARLSKPVYAPRKQRRRPPDKNQGDLFVDGSNNAKALQQGPGEGLAAEAARSAASRSEHRTAAAAGGDGPLYLSSSHCCDERRKKESGKLGPVYRLRPCRCRRWFCRYCGPRQGWKLKQKLRRRVRKFQCVYGITLTLDGSLFESPEQAWFYVMNNRLLSRLVRELYARGYLHSKAYFWSVEFQDGTKQAHWHMLLDASRIPYGEIVEIWSRFRPEFAPPLPEPITAENYKGRAPAFGSVRFTVSGDGEKAVWYATKYLTKYPELGYPDWVLDRPGRMPRFGHSHRFFPREVNHDATCMCPVCLGEAEPPPVPSRPKRERNKQSPEKPREAASTIRHRLERCGKNCSIVQFSQIRLTDGSVIDGGPKYCGKLEVSLEAVCDYLGIKPNEFWDVSLSTEEILELETFAEEYFASKGAA